MKAAIRAGSLYFLWVFPIAFGFGVLRQLVVAPRTGALVAVLIEVPLLLTVSWLLCGRILRRLVVPPTLPARLIMGGMAFALLMAAELALALTLAGQTVARYLASFATLPALIGLVAQVGFALIPLLRR